jgi:predicted nucleic acid-binding protein
VILVDSSVWIGYFNGHDNPQTNYLDELLGIEPIGLGDLILTEVLQGFRTDSGYATARKLLLDLVVYEMVGTKRSMKASKNYRELRSRGVTVRKTVDTIIATFCIEENFSLLFTNKDFIPFVTHLGLRSAFHST